MAVFMVLNVGCYRLHILSLVVVFILSIAVSLLLLMGLICSQAHIFTS